jgi:hypothetical protein
MTCPLLLQPISIVGTFLRHYPQRDYPSCHCGKYGHIKAECFKVKPHKPEKN